jgi:hypothetical protein
MGGPESQKKAKLKFCHFIIHSLIIEDGFGTREQAGRHVASVASVFGLLRQSLYQDTFS